MSLSKSDLSNLGKKKNHHDKGFNLTAKLMEEAREAALSDLRAKRKFECSGS